MLFAPPWLFAASQQSLLQVLATLLLSNFLPHGTCYLWDRTTVWMNVISDSVIAISYYCIPLVLIYLVRRRRDLPFHWVFWMSGLFILSCGTTHLMEVWNIWHANYLLAGIIKAFTATVSVMTAIALFPLIPKALALPSPEHLAALNDELQLQIATSNRREEELTRLTEELDWRVKIRTVELESINQSLQEQIRVGEQTQLALRQSEARFRSVIESATDAVLTVDGDQNLILFNRAAEKIFGCASGEVLGKSIDRFMPERFRALHRDHIRRFGETGVTERGMGKLGSLWGRRANGEEFPMEASISQIETDGKKLFTVIIRDITERRRIEEALRFSEERMRLLLDGVTEYAIYMIDPDGCVLSWNVGAARVKGYGSEEIIGKDFSCFYTPDAQASGAPHANLAKALESGRFEEEGLRVRKDGTTFWAYKIITPMYDQSGALQGFSVIARDITERRRADEEIRKLNQELEQRVHERTQELEAANKELEAFTYSVSHDLRAPLRHIAGFSRMLAEEHGTCLQPEAQHYLKRIQDGTRRMGMLVDDLLNLARIGRQEIRLQVTGLESIVKDAISELKPDTEGRSVEWKIGSLPYVEADPSLLRVVFQNLLANALKYSRPRADAVIEIGRSEIDGESVIFVRDNGVGFDMKYADKLFGVFQRLHRSEDFEGTGVGLATVQRIVNKHGGRIWADAELDKGATFYFSLNETSEPKGQTKPAATGGSA